MKKTLNIAVFIAVLFLTLLFIPATKVQAQTSTNSIRFNGSTGTRVSVPINQGSINVGSGNFTIEWWMKPVSVTAGAACSSGQDVFTNGAIIIDRDIFGEGDNGDFGFSLMSDRRIAFSIHNGSSGVTACSSAIPLNQWSYIAAVRQGSAIRIYVNGALTGSATLAGDLSYNLSRTSSYSADPYLVLGAEKHTAIGGETFTAYHYNGFIDELRISNIARSIAPRTIPFVADSNTVAHFTFENTSNSSVGGITGTRVGATYSTDIPFAPVTTQPTSAPTSNPTSNPTNNPTSIPTKTTNPSSTSTTIPSSTVTVSPPGTDITRTPQDITGTIVDSSATNQPEQTPSDVITNEKETPQKSSFNWLFIIIPSLILLLIAVGFIVFYIRKRRESKETKSPIN